MDNFERHICICSECEIATNKSVLIGRGKKTEFRINNSGRKAIDKYIVDNCLLESFKREEKCDFLFRIEMELIYLVECKGSDVLKAIDQIISTMTVLGKALQGYVIKGRIVPTRVNAPDLRTMAYKRLRERLKGNLIIKNITLTETI